jgi:hypothetical protein
MGGSASAEPNGGLTSERRYFPWVTWRQLLNANLDWHKSSVVEVGAYAARRQRLRTAR